MAPTLVPLLGHVAGIPLEELLVPALPLAGGLAIVVRGWWLHRHDPDTRPTTSRPPPRSGVARHDP